MGLQSTFSQMQKVWFITGTSSGLGRELVHAALARNDKVIATARNLSTIQDLKSESCMVAQLDITADFQTLREKAAEAVAKWGRVDVLVNNAGAGMPIFLEEAGLEGVMRQFNTNFFGALNVTNAFLPYLRSRRSGTIVFVGSRSAYRSNVAMIGAYCASKAALEAAAECLSIELAPLHIRVLNVLPGGLRTSNWSKVNYLAASKEALLPPLYNAKGVVSTNGTEPSTSNGGVQEQNGIDRITDYDETREVSMAWMNKADGAQPGDPIKAAEAIVGVACESDTRKWPGMLVLGGDAERDIRAKCNRVLDHLTEWKDVIRSIDLPE